MKKCGPRSIPRPADPLRLPAVVIDARPAGNGRVSLAGRRLRAG